MSQAVLTDVFMTPEQYYLAAVEYERNLTLEDIMESVRQSDQRVPFMGLRVLEEIHPELGVYNELLVQFVFNDKLGQVVPDNMLVLHVDENRANRKSYPVEHERETPFLVAEYVSDSNPSKDREGGKSYAKYEQQLQVPYYLIHDADAEVPLKVLQHNGSAYDLVLANDQGRFPVPELDLEIALKGDLIRYWHKGELLPIPQEVAELLAERDRTIAETSDQLAEKDQQLAQTADQLAEKDQQLAQTNQQLLEQAAFAAKLQESIGWAVQQNRHEILAELSGAKTVEELDGIMQRLGASGDPSA